MQFNSPYCQIPVTKFLIIVRHVRGFQIQSKKIEPIKLIN